MMKPNHLSYFPALTGLRAVAAYMVFFSHNPLPAKRAGSFLASLTGELYIGVSIFFVLSGFLITIRYQELFTTAAQSFRRYLQNRFARIYPMYFILTTLTFLYYHSSHSSTFFIYLMNITFLRGFFEQLLSTGIGPGWTLTVEECFYILAPLVFLTRVKLKLIWYMVFFYLTGSILVILFKDMRALGFFASFKFMFIRTFFGRCFEFFAGMILANLYKASGNDYLLTRYKTLIGSTGMIVCLLLLTWIKITNAVAYGFFSDAGLIVNNLILPICIALFISGIINEQTLIRRLLESKIAVLLGKSSYSFYLIHVSFIAELIRIHLTHNYLYNFPFLVLLSVILYKLMEEPLTYRLRISKVTPRPVLHVRD